jgi:hypothetical protein
MKPFTFLCQDSENGLESGLSEPEWTGRWAIAWLDFLDIRFPSLSFDDKLSLIPEPPPLEFDR